MSTIFARESRNVQRYTGLPGATKARLWPTVAAILDRARSPRMEIGDQIVLGALNAVLIRGIVDEDYFGVHESLGKILGLDAPAEKSAATVAPPLPIREVTPELGSRKTGAKASPR